MVNLDLKQWSTYNKLKGVARKELGVRISGKF